MLLTDAAVPIFAASGVQAPRARCPPVPESAGACYLRPAWSQSSLVMPFRSQTTLPSRRVSSATSFLRAAHAQAGRSRRTRSRRSPGAGPPHRQARRPRDVPVPRDGSRAPGCQVAAAITSSSDMPMFRNFDMHVEHVLHARVHAVHVQVGGDGIGREALPDGGNRLPKRKAAAAVPHVEDDAALFALRTGRAAVCPGRPAWARRERYVWV